MEDNNNPVREIKRYNVYSVDIGIINYNGADNGEWCKYSDVKQLQKQLSESKYEIEELNELQQNMCITIESLQKERDSIKDKADKLASALEITSKSLFTYGKHPIIEKAVKNALSEYKGGYNAGK